MNFPAKPLRAKLDTAITAGLHQTIDAHGPITVEFLSSASKRVLGQLSNVTYTPDEEAARMAPSMACGLASRMVRLRALVATFPTEIQSNPALQQIIAPLPFEAELLSGSMERVDAALKANG